MGYSIMQLFTKIFQCLSIQEFHLFTRPCKRTTCLQSVKLHFQILFFPLKQLNFCPWLYSEMLSYTNSHNSVVLTLECFVTVASCCYSVLCQSILVKFHPQGGCRDKHLFSTPVLFVCVHCAWCVSVAVCAYNWCARTCCASVMYSKPGRQTVCSHLRSLLNSGFFLTCIQWCTAGYQSPCNVLCHQLCNIRLLACISLFVCIDDSLGTTIKFCRHGDGILMYIC